MIERILYDNQNKEEAPFSKGTVKGTKLDPSRNHTIVTLNTFKNILRSYLLNGFKGIIEKGKQMKVYFNVGAELKSVAFIVLNDDAEFLLDDYNGRYIFRNR